MCASRIESASLHTCTVVTVGDGDATGWAEGSAVAATDEEPATGVGVTAADDVGDGDPEESGDDEGDGEGVGSSDKERRGEPKDSGPAGSEHSITDDPHRAVTGTPTTTEASHITSPDQEAREGSESMVSR